MCCDQYGDLKKLNETLATHTRLLATLANAASPVNAEPESESVPQQK
jgi:hypothetical protein